MRLFLNACVGLIILSSFVVSDEETTTELPDESSTEETSASAMCHANEVFDGKTCNCAPGDKKKDQRAICRYFIQSDKESKLRCEYECGKVYFTFFTYGACVSNIYGRLPKNAHSKCNLRCGMRIRTLASVGIFLTFAAALATLIFTIPLCITTCMSCLNARTACKTAKRVFNETQNQPYKEQQMQTVPYNPYLYWPYYGRT